MRRKNDQCTQFDRSENKKDSRMLERAVHAAPGGRVHQTRALQGCLANLPLGRRKRRARLLLFCCQGNQAHTLVEVMVALSVLGFMIVSLFAGFSSGFAVLRVARENLRATQILEERMEVIRLIKWDDVAPGFIPTNFTAPFYVSGSGSNAPSLLAYTGTVSISAAPLTESYSTNLRMIQIDLNWSSGNIPRTRQMTTFVSKYGLQNYVY